MSYILNIETATKNCSISIAKEGTTLLCIETAEEGYSHAEKLHVFIEEALGKLKITYQDLLAIAVSQGPGSYTGLRIGVSAAKGLCYTLDIPLIAVDTLAVLAAQVKENKGLIIPMIDARRMEVYSAIFTTQLEKIREVKAEVIVLESFSEITSNQTVFFVGDGALKCKEILERENFIFLEKIIHPSSREMSKLSYEKFKKCDTVDVAYFEPYYLKDFMITTKKN